MGQARLRVLFGETPIWREGLVQHLDSARFEMRMQPLEAARLEDYDLVVPLALQDHRHLEAAGCQRSIAVAAPLRRLCTDKVALNRRLIAQGFGAHVPRMHRALPVDTAARPVIVKPILGFGGGETRVLCGGAAPPEVEGWLKAGTHFIQTLVPGRSEFATHVLMRHGRPRMWATVRHEMGGRHLVKGRAQPRAQVWLPRTPGQGLWLKMLEAIGFTDGSCCIDWRMAGDVPQVFEINPRFGGSLRQRINLYLDAYAAAVG